MVLGTSFKAEVFEEHFGDGSDMGLEIEYVTETEPLGTGGGIRNVLPKLRSDNVMVFNGDVLGGTDLGAVLDTHASTEADVTLHLVRVSDPRAFGCVPTDGDGRVHRLPGEDPGSADRPDQRRLLRVPPRVHREDPRRVVRCRWSARCSRACWPRARAIFGHVDTAYWRDMGTPEDFVRGSADLVRGIATSPALPEPARRVAGRTRVPVSRRARC